MTSNATVILLQYTGSPFVERAEAALAYLGVKHALYNYTGTFGLGPRPQLTDHGIAHRRVPTAMIGSELFFESHYFLRKIEELGLAKRSLQPDSIFGLLGANYIEKDIFWKIAQLLPSEYLTEQFMKERKALFGDKKFPDVDIMGSDEHKNAALDYLQATLRDLEDLCRARTEATPYLGSNAEPTNLDFDIYGAFWLGGHLGRGSDLFPAPPFSQGQSAIFPHFSKYLAFFAKKVAEWRAENPPVEVVDFAEASQLTPHCAMLPALPTQPRFRDFLNHQGLIGKEVHLLARDTERQSQKGTLTYVDADEMAIEWVSPILKRNVRAWASKKEYFIRP